MVAALKCMATWTDTTSAPQYFSFIENNELCCAFFTAPWCFRCKQVEEKINALPSNFPAVKLLKINIEDTEDIASILEISTLPTFVLIKNGVEVHRVEGALQQRPARMVAQAIQKHLLQSYEN